jgi:hypothetical protein
MNFSRNCFYSFLLLFLAFPLAAEDNFSPKNLVFEPTAKGIGLYEIKENQAKRLIQYADQTYSEENIHKSIAKLNEKLSQLEKQNLEVNITLKKETIEESGGWFKSVYTFILKPGDQILEPKSEPSIELIQCQSELEAYKEIVMGLATGISSGKITKDSSEQGTKNSQQSGIRRFGFGGGFSTPK